MKFRNAETGAMVELANINNDLMLFTLTTGPIGDIHEITSIRFRGRESDAALKWIKTQEPPKGETTT